MMVSATQTSYREHQSRSIQCDQETFPLVLPSLPCCFKRLKQTRVKSNNLIRVMIPNSVKGRVDRKQYGKHLAEVYVQPIAMQGSISEQYRITMIHADVTIKEESDYSFGEHVKHSSSLSVQKELSKRSSSEKGASFTSSDDSKEQPLS